LGDGGRVAPKLFSEGGSARALTFGAICGFETASHQIVGDR